MATTDIRGATVDATDAPSSSTPNAGLAIKTPVRVATTGSNIVLNGLQTIDGIALAGGDRVLVKDQTLQATNGIYNASTGNWAASSDFQNNTQLASGSQVYVNEGALNANTSWVLQDTDPVVLGTSTLTFVPLLSFNQLARAVPFYPVVNPSSGNIQGSGTPVRHQLVWSDSNPVFWADILEVNSTDPSALATITVTGTPANGVLVVGWAYGGISNLIFVNVTAAMTTTQVAAAIVAAVQANAALFNPPSALNTAGGGYANGALIGFIINEANEVAYDYNVLYATSVSYGPGTTGLTLTFGAGQNTPSTLYSLPQGLDNNPVIAVSRSPGVAPAPNSVIFGLQVNGPQSNSPTVISVDYGVIELQVLNSTTNSIASRWAITTPGSSGSFTGNGITIGAGLQTAGQTDEGQGTINAVSYYVSGVQALTSFSGAIELLSTAGQSIDLVPGTGQVIVTKTGTTASLTILGDTNQIQTLEFQDTGAIRWQVYKPASSTDLRFNDGAADRLALSNGGAIAVPTGPLTLGNAGTTAGQLAFANATSGTITITPPTGALGSVTLTLPDTTSTLAGLAIAETFTAVQTIMPTQAANTSVDGLVLTDATAATSGNQQFSPRLRLTGQGWKTAATAASQTVDWIVENQPVQGSSAPTTNLVFSAQVNGGGYTALATLSSAANLNLATGHSQSAGLALSGNVAVVADATYTYLVSPSGQTVVQGSGSANFFTSNTQTFQTAGSVTQMILASGMQVGAAPTGGDKGAGTINVAAGIYLNNTAYTNPDYAFEHYYTGRVEKFAAPQAGGSSWGNRRRASYPGLMTLAELEAHVRATLRLPGITEEAADIFERADIALEKIEEATLYIFELNRRIAALEARAA